MEKIMLYMQGIYRIYQWYKNFKVIAREQNKAF
jgi:hypothetical protein